MPRSAKGGSIIGAFTKEKNMRSKVIVRAVAAGVILFASGVAIGQRTNASKFDKYLRPTSRTDMDFIALEASVKLIQDVIPGNKGIFIPQVFFNYQEHRPQAFVSVTSEFEKGSLDTIKSQIIERYYLAYYGVAKSIPELSQDDFVLVVTRLTESPDSNRRIYAECKHGDIVFY
jgi:hypothetical protein